MTKEEVKLSIDTWNAHVEQIKNEVANRWLIEHGYKPGKIPMDRLIAVMGYVNTNTRALFEQTRINLKAYRADGWDVKMNMQSETLVFYGEI